LRSPHGLQDFLREPLACKKKRKLGQKATQFVPIVLHPVDDLIHGCTLAWSGLDNAWTMQRYLPVKRRKTGTKSKKRPASRLLARSMEIFQGQNVLTTSIKCLKKYTPAWSGVPSAPSSRKPRSPRPFHPGGLYEKSHSTRYFLPGSVRLPQGFRPDFQPLLELALGPGRVHDDGWLRSEEHTSELQSQSNLVCRLLLE